MRFKIKEDKEEVSEIKIELELKSVDGEKGIRLTAKNNEGQSRTIMHFIDGKFAKIGFADMKGIDTDKYGEIMEIKL